MVKRLDNKERRKEIKKKLPKKNRKSK